ncbi:hypothetical protein [Paraburkholderia sp.]|uniref:hypothetical protein n=1 Tax=Paraburkholderia sp. TaxID=1926495 RepID=UPI002AFE9050|nr:hypothetical protein [Paraburkholderia sp.]
MIRKSNEVIRSSRGGSIKSRTNVMVGFKRFRNAAATISGIELMHRIRKGLSDPQHEYTRARIDAARGRDWDFQNLCPATAA